MIFMLILLAAVVLLLGLLTLTRIDRLERKIDELARQGQAASPDRPQKQEPTRTSRTDTSGRHAPAPAPAEPPATPVRAFVPPADLTARQTARTACTASETESGTELRLPETEAAQTPPLRQTPPPLPSRTQQTPPPAPAPPAVRQVQRSRKTDYEKYIGENLFGKIGIFVLIVGVGFFVKYAIDNDWLGEGMRTALGFAVGAALMGLAARLRDRYRSFSSLLAGGAFAVCYVTIAVAYHYYSLFSQGWTFALLVLTTLLMTGIAIGYDRRELAVVALAGGLVAPFLTSSGEGNYLMLFSYLTILHAGMFALSLYKKWWELPVISFAATWLIMALFVPKCFTYEADRMIPRHMLGFSTLFFLLFASAIVAVFRTRNNRFRSVLLGVITLNNFLYLCFGLTFLSGLGHNFSEGGVIPLFIAAVNAGLLGYVRRRKEQIPLLCDLLLGLTILFITLVVWCQFKEYTNTLTVCLAAESVLLVWLYVRSRIPVYEYAAATLCGLTFLAAVVILCTDREEGVRLFLNRECLTVLSAAAALACGARITGRRRDLFAEAKALHFPTANVLLIISAFVLAYAAFVRDIVACLSGAVLAQALLLCTVTMLAGTQQLLRNRFPIARCPKLHIAAMCIAVCFFLLLCAGFENDALPAFLSWISTAVVVFLMVDTARRFYRNIPEERPRRQFTILLNLLAALLWIMVVCRVLSQVGLRDEFSAGFSVALISAGTLQMALGMRRHQKVLRLFSLGVFAVVLVKLLAHDLWGMPTIGRIVVFILLGAILLVLSFLYQRLKTALFKEDE